MFPLLLKLKDRLCLVVGGGPVGWRKASALLEGGARVRLVCLEQRPPAPMLPALEWHAEPYRAEHLDGCALAFAAATAEVNRQVVADARGRGLWVNSATDPDASDFFVPATVRRGDFVLAVSTGGAAPGLARSIRQRLEAEFDDTFGQWVALLVELRPVVMSRVTDAEQRRAVFERLSSWSWLERLRHEEVDMVRTAMLGQIAALAIPPDVRL